MTQEIILVLVVLLAAVVLFVTEKLRVDLVALLVLLALAISGVIDHEHALLGFSNHAVIAIASVLVLSGGLQRTGVANLVGRQVLRLAGTGERRMIAVMMTTVGLLSGIMNDIGVTALLLPVVLDIARRLGRPPSKLLMPLAFGSLLGGMTTLIGTSPNILIAGALEDHGLEPFSMFDFTPVGLAALAVGVVYMTFWGHRLLPDRDPGRESRAASEGDFESVYHLGKVLFTLTLPPGSALAGRTLAQSRVGVALGLNVLAILRDGHRILAPGPGTALAAGDALMVEGDRKRLQDLRDWQHLEVADAHEDLRRTVDEAVRGHFVLAEAELGKDSELAGKTLRDLDFRRRFGLHVFAHRRGAELHFTGLRAKRLEPGDVLLVSGLRAGHDKLRDQAGLGSYRYLTATDLENNYRLEQQLLSVRVPETSLLAGKRLAETRLGRAFGLSVVGILRADETLVLPDPAEALHAGDHLLIQGRREDLRVLGALQDLEVDEHLRPDVDQLESDQVGVAEVVLSPRSTLAGSTLRQLLFRERYGLSVLAVWRRGKAYRSRLARMQLRMGDAFLVYGDRGKLALLAREPDFVVLSGDSRAALEVHKAPRSALIMAGVLASVASGLLPIYIAAPAGAALMVLSGCLTMEDAYRFIEWKALLLIAGMLSLGLAMQESGAAELIAHGVLGTAAAYGTTALIAGLFVITALSAQVMPTAAVAVLISPIALASADELGLSPYAMLMVVAVASSCAFMSPVGHPVNLLVMGVGGYRFTDYTKVGLPLTILVFLVVLFVLPLVWPLELPPEIPTVEAPAPS
ncbi:MAG: SLC13 family permease [bacterium]|nr:SLC13 family permease [bacterium]